jgi:hypothetical protein
MPCEGAIIFRDLVGELDVLNVECNKCGRSAFNAQSRCRINQLITTPLLKKGPDRT